MLLRVGTIMMAVALALALGVAVVVGLRSEEAETVPLAAPADPPSAEEPTREKEPDSGSKPEIKKGEIEEKAPEKAAEREESEGKAPGRPASPPPAQPPANVQPPANAAQPAKGRQTETLPVSREDWPQPSGDEVAAANGPRYYPPAPNAELSLTVPSIGLYDVPVINSNSREALDQGVIHLPQTPMPWEEREQKNVYLAGHRLGYPDTGSRLVFYNLDKLHKGDSVVLEDSLGNPYEYRVSETFVVDPNADWAVDPVRDRDMVTLQTCTWPNFENRIIVRADRV